MFTCTSCSEEYYLDAGYCTPCIYPCITCKTETLCFTCGYDTEFRNPPPTCSCRDDFYDVNNSCLMCTAPCKTCTSTT
jgi:hypothetical protein